MALELYVGGYYALYVAILRIAVQVMTFLSVLVSADRLLNVLKYAWIRVKAYFTGKLPQHAWNFKSLPDEPLDFPKVRCFGFFFFVFKRMGMRF